MLAEVAGAADPLDVEVVEAYWLGSDLGDLVDPGRLVAFLKDRFRGQPGGTWRSAFERARAHHSFQVFEVYPWATLLIQGRPAAPAVEILDRCRIRTGVVQEVDDEAVVVRSAPLHWDGRHLDVSEPVLERARWSVEGRSLITQPLPGQTVALHWDWVCEPLTDAQAVRVEESERRQREQAGLSVTPGRG